MTDIVDATQAGRPAGEQTGAPAGDEPGFPGLLPAAPAPGGSTGYRVLARKYRPQTFDDLIGQDALVRTVSNAFTTGRIPQAWMLTGVRGVGKTTTARILARALNYDLDDGRSGPTIAMPELGIHCRAIMESRHVDVLEMDAASHTGVDNMRNLTDSVRYSPAQARYKVYIIDEVHMLSTAAFNAFLKTLEEPPPHAKFVFATTEIRKVPVTILSRCQRFDLRRVESGTLAAHLGRICEAEAVEAEPDAIAAIVRAAEGSVRDALSLLDQAVAHGAGRVGAAAVRDMLGLADRGQVIDLFEAAMRGDVPRAFEALRAVWNAGADPGQAIADLAGFTHLVTRIKLAPDAALDPALSEAERVRGSEFAGRLSVRALSRAWQILSKAAPEVAGSQRPLAAAEMALVRLAYAADLPTPDEALRRLRDGGLAPAALAAPSATGGAGVMSSGGSATAWSGEASAARAPEPAPHGQAGGSSGSAAYAAPMTAPMAASAPQPQPQPGIALARFADFVALAGEKREIGLKTALEQDVRLVRFEDGRFEFALAPGGAPSLQLDIARTLKAWTGRTWAVAISQETGEPTLAEQRRAREEERRSDAASHPLVRAVLESFPGAEIVDVRQRATAAVAEAAALEAAAETAPPDDETPDDI